MPTVRQDAWTQEEDLLLAEVVLRHIREGGTQLQAFEEAGKQMNRTAAACGFRWNSLVRKQYKAEIETAKQQRKERKQQMHEKEDKEHVWTEPQPADRLDYSAFSLFDAIRILQEIALKSEQDTQQLSNVRRGADEWKQKYEQLQQQYQDEKEKYEQLQKEYSALLSIMDKARKLVEQEV
ncbi:RsfA family transcriptional regulator [Heyndrickxia acidiproducens]|uniref:RsfA family transcriptional regulator n=1 Tax=Heyndrickxia acidiproducens TaxID=1121084 RepID=UPI000363CF53|nr:RsfA family transcriptional regulator [Heyndrickxia acidiproducens]